MQNEDEINLLNLLKLLIEFKWLIFGLTGFVTLLAFIYTLSFKPTYKATILFVSPNENSVVIMNQLELMDESRNSIYKKFLTNLVSTKFQKKVFFENDYLTKFNTDNKIIDDADDFAFGFVSSIKLGETDLSPEEMTGTTPENPTQISMEGANHGEIMSQFLNDLTNEASVETINDLYSLLKLKIDIRLSEIALERKSLLSIAKEERLNEIQLLTSSAQMARSMGIIENNFKQINSLGGETGGYSLQIDTLDTQVLSKNLYGTTVPPKWYLYGEKALSERIKWLKEHNTNDAAFATELLLLEIKKIELESILELNPNEIQAMQVVQNLPPTESMPQKRFVVIVGFIVGLIGSIILVMVYNALRPRDESIA